MFIIMTKSTPKETVPSDNDLALHLRKVGLRPTRQRMALAEILFRQGDRHITAETLYTDAVAQGVNVSLATVYNALHTFTAKGLLREISIDSTRSYFDTNTSDHNHFYFEKSGRLQDIEVGHVKLAQIPEAPEGKSVSRVDVIVRING